MESLTPLNTRREKIWCEVFNTDDIPLPPASKSDISSMNPIGGAC